MPRPWCCRGSPVAPVYCFGPSPVWVCARPVQLVGALALAPDRRCPSVHPCGLSRGQPVAAERRRSDGAAQLAPPARVRSAPLLAINTSEPFGRHSLLVLPAYTVFLLLGLLSSLFVGMIDPIIAVYYIR